MPVSKRTKTGSLDSYLNPASKELSFDELRDRHISEGILNLRDKIRDMKIETTSSVIQEEVETLSEAEKKEKLKSLGDKSYDIYRNQIKPKPEKEKVIDQPITIASQAEVQARMRQLVKGRSSGNVGKPSPVGPNGSGNQSNCDNNINFGLYPTSLTIEEYEDYINGLFEEVSAPEVEETILLHESKPEPTNSTESIAVSKLEEELLQLEDSSWQAIDTLMRSICKEHDLTPKELHKEFKKVHGMIPDDWIKEQKQITETCGWFPLNEIVRLNKVGVVYDVTFVFRGNTQRIQFFWPEWTRPTKAKMQKTVEKLYPTAKLIVFYPAVNQNNNNSMVVLSPVKEYYDPLQRDDWEQMSEASTMIYEEICTEEGEPITPPYLVEDGIYEVMVEDHDTGEEKAIRFEEIGEPGDGMHFCLQELQSKTSTKSKKTRNLLKKPELINPDN